MPTKKYFDQCPEFPSDVPVANIPTLSYRKLESDDEAEVEILYEACREHGFFLLNLTDCENGQVLLNNAEKMFDISAQTLSLDRKTLDKYAYNPPKDLLGYKTAGKLKTDDGKLDAMEMYTLGQDDMMGTIPPRKNPEPIETRRQDCQDYFRHAHDAISTILNQLDKKLNLKRGTLATLSPLQKPSDTSVRMLVNHPETPVDNKRITLGGHTDIGTITMLFNVAGGLQILPAESENLYENWRYIKPKQGCALINLGDTMVEWTGEILRSALHRVVAAPGEQRNFTRQSLAYLVRPDRELTMQRLQSPGVIPSVVEGEADIRSVSEWAATRARQIMNGELKPRTTGGRPMVGQNSTTNGSHPITT